MLHARVGVPSAIQDSTFHQNRESANETPDLTFLSKGELRRMIEVLCLEKAKIKDEKLKLAKEVIFYQRECVVLNNTIIQMNQKSMGIEYEAKPIMRVIRTGD